MSPAPSKPMLMFPLGRRKIGRYELLHPIASGGMATVFTGRFFGMGGFEKLVAIKVIHPHLAGDNHFIEMFLDEARLSAKIRHPNALEIFEVGEDDGLLFIVAELIQGQNLDELILAAERAGAPLEPRLFLTMIAKVCEALHAAHSLASSDGSPVHLVHRDISPSNILISYNGIVKLIDFGIAFAKERLSTTRSDIVKGKRGYTAPEQLKKETVDRRTDIFSLGVVLYYGATGKHPFSGDTEAQHVFELLNSAPVPPRALQPNLSHDLEKTILKALAKDPDKRHSTAEELGLELRRLLVPLGGLADTVEISNWMERTFSREIHEDKQALEQAQTTPPGTEATPWPHKLPSSEIALNQPMGKMNRATGDSDGNRPRPLAEAVRATQLLGLSTTQEKSFRHQAWALPVLGAATLGLLLVLYPLFRQTAGDPGWRVTTTDPHRTDQNPTAGEQTTSRSVADTIPAAPAQPSPISSDTASLPLSAGRSVELVLRGLPEQSRVTLDDRDVVVTDGRVQVPGDGQSHQLAVFAKGYLPYQKTISPDRNGELMVQLSPQAGQRQTLTKRKTAEKKDKRGTLSRNPYDTQ